MSEPSTQRADLWIWAVRLAKTRSLAADHCRAGRVRRGSQTLKPSSLLRVGDILEVPGPWCTRSVRVEALPPRRVGAPDAAACFHDLTDPAAVDAARAAAREAALSNPLPAPGRPSKADRRQIEKLRETLRDLGYPSDPA